MVQILSSLLEDFNISVSLTATQHSSLQKYFISIYWVAQVGKQ